MKEKENINLIKEHFAAFGKGNLQSALNMIAEKVDWRSPCTRTEHKKIIWAKPHYSREEVAEFFKELGAVVKPEKFEIHSMIAQDDRVVVEGSNRGTVRATGKSYEHDWVMVFTLKDGEIIRHRQYYDTAEIIHAFEF